MRDSAVSILGYFENWRRNGLTIAFVFILFCFLMGNDHYNVSAMTRKNRMISSNQEIISYQKIPAAKPSWLVSKYLAGGDTCAAATNVTTSPFNDTGNTTGGNNTITTYNHPNLPFPYPGPDHFYQFTIGAGGGTVQAVMTLTGSTLDGALFLTNVCPAGTGNTIPAVNTIQTSQDQIGPGAGPENMPNPLVPIPLAAGTYYIAVDSYYAAPAPAASGPYSITITTTNLAPPVAAGVNIGGRIVNANGIGINGTRVSLTYPSGEVITVKTNAFGYYKFEDLEVGSTYTVQVADKRYQFANPTQVVTLEDAVEDLDFTAQP